jgi:hypothetical protein
MKGDIRTARAYAWEMLYEQAIGEADTALRRLRLLEAQEAILERARMLDVEVGEEHESEAKALEEAADFVREMKLETQADGLGKEVRVGDKKPISGRPKLPKDASSSVRED